MSIGRMVQKHHTSDIHLYITVDHIGHAENKSRFFIKSLVSGMVCEQNNYKKAYDFFYYQHQLRPETTSWKNKTLQSERKGLDFRVLVHV